MLYQASDASKLPIATQRITIHIVHITIMVFTVGKRCESFIIAAEITTPLHIFGYQFNVL